MQQRIQSSTLRKLALAAALAAFYTIARAIPISRLIGISGSITAGGVIAPIIGVLLEPSFAVAAVFVGTITASLFPWNPLKFYGLDFLPGALNVAVVSLTIRGMRRQAIILFVFVLATFLVVPNTEFFVGAQVYSPPVPYVWLHLIGLAVLLSPLSKNIGTRIASADRRTLALAVVVVAFTGTMIEHVTGGVLFAVVVGRGALAAWRFIFVAYPIERAILVTGAVIVCTPILLVLRNTISQQSRTASRVFAAEQTIARTKDSIE